MEHLGLIPALDLLVADLSDDSVKGRVEVLGKVRRLRSDTELALYRIAQEALSNIKKHSQATEVILNVEFKQNRVRMTVLVASPIVRLAVSVV